MSALPEFVERLERGDAPAGPAGPPSHMHISRNRVMSSIIGKFPGTDIAMGLFAVRRGKASTISRIGL